MNRYLHATSIIKFRLNKLHAWMQRNQPGIKNKSSSTAGTSRSQSDEGTRVNGVTRLKMLKYMAPFTIILQPVCAWTRPCLVAFYNVKCRHDNRMSDIVGSVHILCFQIKNEGQNQTVQRHLRNSTANIW